MTPPDTDGEEHRTQVANVTNLPNSWVLGRSGGDLADRYIAPSGLTREVVDEGSDLPWEAGGLRFCALSGWSVFLGFS